MTDIIAHGALFDGTTDDTAAWVSAIAAAQASDLTVECPAGRSIVSDPDFDTQAIAIENIGVSIRGKGRDATFIVLAPGQNCHVVSFKNTIGGGLFDLTVDGQRDCQTAGHTIRGENVERLTIARVMAKNARHYGLGFQAGIIRDLTVDDVIVQDVGGDGIDFKNPLNGNAGNILRAVRVRRHGLGSTDQAGIDLRGPVLLSDIVIEDVAESHVGIRFREDGPSTGVGAHQSVLTGFRIIGASKTNTLGVSCVARDVSIANGYIEGVLRPVQTQAEMFSAVNVRAHDCVDGFYAATPGGDDATFVACRVTSAAKGLRAKRFRAEFAACVAKDCGASFYADPTGTQMRVTGGKSITPTTAHRGGTLANISPTGLLEV
jgi:hypothetical protein